MSNEMEKDQIVGAPICAIALHAELSKGKMHRIRTMQAGDTKVEIKQGQDGLWVIMTQENLGGFALRAAYTQTGMIDIDSVEKTSDGYTIKFTSPVGAYQVRVAVPDPTKALARATTTLTPSENLLTPYWPRDLYPIDAEGNPLATEGKVHAGQRGVNGGLVYLTLLKPCSGSLLYFQNLTALNPYFITTGTKPDGIVGGIWPELGCQLPTVKDPTKPPIKPLAAGQEYVISDAFLNYRAEIPVIPRQSARLFLDLMADVYVHLDRPTTEFHDWIRRAEETYRDLDKSPKATIAHYGDRYVHPYTGFEYPDSMVQMTVATTLREYERWKEKSLPLVSELRKGMHRFYDEKLKVIRRYLPNVGEDKDADAVDSWYLYHPLTNLARWAQEGDEEARDLFLGSLEYAMMSARHFNYNWPIQYNVETMEVISATRKEQEPGQSDAGGLYAYVMIKAWEMTREPVYLEEAEKAIQATSERNFDLAYQTNLTAWGVNACIHLWRITGNEYYREQSYVFLASFFHNTVMWESEIDFARHYTVFMGETCLHDAPYMAIYECFESYCAFYEYINKGQEDLPDSVRLLVTEYLKYTLTRAWYYYPKELPEEVLATEIRNNEIDRKLAFPLEDLYPDGQPAGQVGQEIYGCGAAFALLTRAFYQPENAPFIVFCEYPLSDIQTAEDKHVTFEVRGVEGLNCRLRVLPKGRKTLPSCRVYLQEAYGAKSKELEGTLTPEGHCDFTVPAGRRIMIHCEE